MKILFHRNFEKQYRRLREREKSRCKERLAIFLKDPFSATLNNHPLHGTYKGYRSINVAGDLRAIYKMIEPDVFLFVAVDSHSKLYS